MSEPRDSEQLSMPLQQEEQAVGEMGNLSTAFPFLSFNEREGKPRSQGITEIRGPYYTPLGPRMLSDVLELAADHVDCLKFAGGSFSIMPEAAVRNITQLCHDHQVKVSTGGFLERVLASGAGPTNVIKYMETCRDLGFDILEISTGFISLPLRDWQRLVEDAQEVGLQAKPEVGIQFGAGGTSSVSALEAEGTRDVRQLVKTCKAFIEQGVELIMIESEGITEQVTNWRTDVISTIMSEVGPQYVMFEAAEPEVFSWYVKNYGPEVNLFVDHSQILQLECLRRGVWGTNDTWGRIVTYKGGERKSSGWPEMAGVEGREAGGSEKAEAPAGAGAAGVAVR